ncbi:MAG: carbohydrate ABC transporter permease [bacterium]
MAEAVVRPTKAKSELEWWRRRSVQRRIWITLVYAVLIVASTASMMPLVWMISTSLKTPHAVYRWPIEWVPRPVVWGNYREALFGTLPFTTFFRNTMYVTFFAMIGQLLTSTLVAFGFARLRAPGRDVLFLMVLSTMMLPPQVTMIPVYIIFNKLGWIDTFKPLIIPYWFGGGAFYIFLLRQFYMTVPIEIDDAAKIDGCGSLAIYWRIILPLSKPAIATVAIFSFMFHWNEFFGPLIYLSTQSRFTVAVGLKLYQNQFGHASGNPFWNLLMAASLVATLPCLIIFFLFQRQFIQGINLTGLKG